MSDSMTELLSLDPHANIQDSCKTSSDSKSASKMSQPSQVHPTPLPSLAPSNMPVNGVSALYGVAMAPVVTYVPR
jgi:hypothetical protein